MGEPREPTLPKRDAGMCSLFYLVFHLFYAKFHLFYERESSPP